jgi:hypothetical protein
MVKKVIESGFQMKGIYKLNYTINKIPEELVVEVELKMIEGMQKSRQNVYEGFAKVNGSSYTVEDLSNCVNAKLAAQSIGKRMRDEMMKKCKEDKKVFKITMDSYGK